MKKKEHIHLKATFIIHMKSTSWTKAIVAWINSKYVVIMQRSDRFTTQTFANVKQHFYSWDEEKRKKRDESIKVQKILIKRDLLKSIAPTEKQNKTKKKGGS